MYNLYLKWQCFWFLCHTMETLTPTSCIFPSTLHQVWSVCDAHYDPRLAVHQGRGLPRVLTQGHRRVAWDKEPLKLGDAHRDVKRPFLVHHPKVVTKFLPFNEKAAKLSEPEVDAGTAPPPRPPSYCCCNSELGLALTPRQVRAPSWHPTRQGPRPAKNRKEKKNQGVAQPTWILISLLILPPIIPK